ncbi:C2H2 finger domain-containing protein [Bisporella sp. PMI_857]|nr:C2H2 finger domain-containing protein [Bisporella sp. PMI_857]
MGAEQSSPRGDASGHTNTLPKKTDYYELLGIERSATEDEIKRAYRRRALELHPDRNFGDVENATRKFAELQAAHEVLSDPQERAWYDSHRDDILEGNDGTSKVDNNEDTSRFTSTKDIIALISRFGPTVPFTDTPNGFYGILRKTFQTLAEEEYNVCSYNNTQPLDYPDFGTSTDDYEQVVRPFYRVWSGFSTKKTYSWRDQYKTSDGPDRTIRRLIEKENKKRRDEGIRQFNDAVTALVAFARKRDPRYLRNLKTDEERQRILRDAAAAQAARSRAAYQAKLNQHVVPEWAKSTKPPEEATFSESEESEAEHIECVACAKIFKSEKQYEAHERSKKHIKNVNNLKREMYKENKRLGLDSAYDNKNGIPAKDIERLELEGEASDTNNEDGVADREEDRKSEHNLQALETTSGKIEELGDSDAETSYMGSEYASREEVEQRLVNSLNGVATAPMTSTDGNNSASISTPSDTDSVKPKLGKAKLKKAKKAAARQALDATNNQEFACTSCNTSFPSKNKLFDHLKRMPSHANPVVKGKGKDKNR